MKKLQFMNKKALEDVRFTLKLVIFFEYIRQWRFVYLFLDKRETSGYSQVSLESNHESNSVATSFGFLFAVVE